MEYGGKFLVNRVLAPIIEPSAIILEPKIITSRPIHTSLPIITWLLSASLVSLKKC